ncbi:competence/damage-inducible protein A [bacterium]|nr:competence/damage-inducible protein A [bacterium]
MVEIEYSNAIIISTGTELLLGNIENSNAMFIANKLAGLGINCHKTVSIGDNIDRLVNLIKDCYMENDIFIITGGLGGTVDDITKEAISNALEIPLVNDEILKKEIEKKYKENGLNIVCKKESLVFSKNALLIENKTGSAPGFFIKKDNKIFILLPGVPNEMKTMFSQVKKHLLENTNNHIVIISKILKTVMIKEIEINDKIKHLFERSKNPTIALLAKPGEVLIRLTAKGKREKINSIFKPVLEKIYGILGDFIWGEDEELIEGKLGGYLKDKNLTIAGAESCTGGLIGKLLTDISGSSQYYLGGMITYSNETKEKLLGVRKETLDRYGAVSKEVAKEMLIGIRNHFNSHLGYAVTGIAGPTGGTEGKPVGTVFLGYFINDKLVIRNHRFMGTRSDIRRQAAHYLLFYLYKELLNENIYSN